MPNLCECKLTVDCPDDEIVSALLRVVAGTKRPKRTWLERILLRSRKAQEPGPGLLEYLQPMPARLWQEADNSNGFHVEPEWRKWRVTHWGCAYEPDSVDLVAKEDRKLVLGFETAWAPPIEAARAGARRLGFDFRMTFFGGDFVGWGTSSEEKLFPYCVDEPLSHQGIPFEILQDFGLGGIDRSTST